MICQERMRRASEAHPEVRSAIHHGFSRGELGLTLLGYGNPIGYTTFRPMNSSGDFWTQFFFSEVRRKQSDLEYTMGGRKNAYEFDREWHATGERILARAQALFDDAMCLIQDADLSKIPGIPENGLTDVRRTSSSWVWLLFHVAWAKPAGTILCAGKHYPIGELARVRFTRWQMKNVGKEISDSDRNSTLESIFESLESEVPDALTQVISLAFFPAIHLPHQRHCST